MMMFGISANMQATSKLSKNLFALMLMNLPNTDSWKYETYLSLSHLKVFFPITRSAQGECCHFYPE